MTIKIMVCKTLFITLRGKSISNSRVDVWRDPSDRPSPSHHDVHKRVYKRSILLAVVPLLNLYWHIKVPQISAVVKMNSLLRLSSNKSHLTPFHLVEAIDQKHSVAKSDEPAASDCD